jgi:hypothetical protein
METPISPKIRSCGCPDFFFELPLVLGQTMQKAAQTVQVTTHESEKT